MTALLRAELLRIRSRRLTWVALGVVLLVVALSQLAVAGSMRPVTAAERAQAQVAYQQAVEDYDENHEQYEQECRDSGLSAEDCAYPPPRLEDYVARSVSTFEAAGQLVVVVTVAFSGLALLLLGASVTGAELSSGALANWLTFVPERNRVFAAKVLALVLVAAVSTAVVTALALAVTAVIARVVGGPLDGLGDLAAVAARGVLVGVAAVVVGFGLALLTRHTIAAAGTVLGYLILSGVLAVVWGAVPALAGVQRYLPENNLLALLLGRHEFYTSTEVAQPDGTFESTAVTHVISLTHGAVYWAVVVAALVAVTLVVFRRRDVN
ncbi:ABC-type transport system involved in multi-copper enzyme maturation, permease component [Friedmanniella luteola]|uniref:ABC-type transport system involved in multi-copper enzyme maturation, permease component n=1 Tax=Friedmanniella luteola TaxID=546871 RepID=A0A1H1NT67_9ACTN|nr:ABC transporter permease subunit [Friedmanniella luteola]SDS02176.1 ABC-type transport system involved in multi-copper enzyme maturation, permease component [Friedmanniella luteola]